MIRRRFPVVLGFVLLLVSIAAVLIVRNQVKVARSRQARATQATKEHQFRQQMFDMLRPVALTNCQLERFGEPNDGGYLMCANLLQQVEAGYSYGISGYDKWGCDISTRLNVPVHQYDCFNTTEPSCAAGRTIFHAECVDAKAHTTEGRIFDTIQNQLAKNGDAGKHIALKIDVEGAEWESFLRAPDEVMNKIDQIAVEFHGVQNETYFIVIQRLREFFHVVHIHHNNYACKDGLEPFPAWAYEVLFVSKRIGIVDPVARRSGVHALDAPNNPGVADCPSVVPNARRQR